MIDVYLTALLSDWLTRQEENSSCKFGALQVIKVGHAGVYCKTGNEKRPTFRKSTYIVYRMSRQDNAIFVEQSFSTEVVSYFYVP